MSGHIEHLENRECPKCESEIVDYWYQIGNWGDYTRGIECVDCGYRYDLEPKERDMSLEETNEIRDGFGLKPIKEFRKRTNKTSNIDYPFNK